MGEEVRSGGCKHVHCGRRAAEEVEPAVAGGRMLMGAGTEEITQFIVASTEPVSRSLALEPKHLLVTTFDVSVILLQSIVEITADVMLHAFTMSSESHGDSCRGRPWSPG
jgi:hypothetical protein